MPTLKILHYKYHRYAAWPHIVYAKQGADEYIAALYWLQTTLKKSQFRINHDKNSFAWFPIVLHILAITLSIQGTY